jgi:predicted GIY-YIG superfamily endonuclease
MDRKIKGYWTFNNVKDEALKYTKRNDFNKLAKSAYLTAYKNGWLDDVCSHMKINDYTFDRVKEEALKFSTRSDFRNNSNSYYTSAHRNGWIDNVCSHMNLQGSLYNRYVYKVSFDDNSIYIGLTYNFNKRKIEHLSCPNSAVYKHMKETGLNPSFELITKDLLSREDAAKLECEIIDEYRILGFNILNAVKGGGLGGSNTIWTIDRVKEEALKYDSRNVFRLKSPSAYISAHRNGWLDDVCSHMINGRKSNGYWTIDRVREEALKYNNKKSFEKGSSSYQIAHKNGWLDDVCSHMINGRKSNGYWTFENVSKEALKFIKRSDFKRESSSAYSTALRNGWLDQVCSHMINK